MSFFALGIGRLTEALAHKTLGLVPGLDAALVQQILHIPQGQREVDVKHDREADDLWARLEVSERGAFGHPGTLARRPGRLKTVSSDNTVLPRLCFSRTLCMLGYSSSHGGFSTTWSIVNV